MEIWVQFRSRSPPTADFARLQQAWSSACDEGAGRNAMQDGRACQDGVGTFLRCPAGAVLIRLAGCSDTRSVTPNLGNLPSSLSSPQTLHKNRVREAGCLIHRHGNSPVADDLFEQWEGAQAAGTDDGEPGDSSPPNSSTRIRSRSATVGQTASSAMIATSGRCGLAAGAPGLAGVRVQSTRPCASKRTTL